MKFLLGTKQAMSQIFEADGTVVPVTAIKIEPNTVTGVRSAEKDGYAAVQLGLGRKTERRIAKPQRGEWKDLGNFRWVKEFRLDSADGFEAGEKLDVSVFSPGDLVDVTGWSKGKGFAGVVKRHHFKGGPASHGHKDNLRAPGSIGATFPQHVVKGTRMAGRLGAQRSTAKKLRVMAVKPETNELLITGAVPGARNGLVIIRLAT